MALVMSYLLQATAREASSNAVAIALHLFGMIVEIFVIGLNVGVSLIGEATENRQNEIGKRN